MSIGSPKLARREHAIEATRRRLRRLEIETHRIKAELARLEADYEDDVADWLSRKLRRKADGAAKSSIPLRVAAVPPAAGVMEAGEPAAVRVDFHPLRQDGNGLGRGADAKPRAGGAPLGDAKPRAAGAGLVSMGSDGAALGGRRSGAVGYRKAASPVLCSFVLHAVVLSLCVTFTIATVARQEVPLLSTPAELDESSVEEFADVEIPPTRFEDSELQNVAFESPDFNVSDQLSDLEAVELGVGTQELGEIGQLDALPGDLGTLMAGAGDPGGGAPGGPMGEAVFFGARSKGTRFVFVVDNSSSMKGGRLEMATAELLRATEALSPKQSFYVIFVSDQVYPMFFPSREPDVVPATPANKKRLTEWLPKAILASGNNRQLMKAMDDAAALRPDAVFLLWDGDLKYSDKVRMEVMTHLTRPNQWGFVIHTLGMGVTSLDAEQNLTAIAQAHGGVFRRVDVPGGRGR